MNFLQMSSQECLPYAKHLRKINSAEPYEGCICSPLCVCVCVCVCVCSVAQSRPTLCDPVDCSPLVSSVHGIFLARILEWVAMSSSRGTFLTQELNPYLLHLLHWQVNSLPLCHLQSLHVSHCRDKQTEALRGWDSFA